MHRTARIVTMPEHRAAPQPPVRPREPARRARASCPRSDPDGVVARPRGRGARPTARPTAREHASAVGAELAARAPGARGVRARERRSPTEWFAADIARRRARPRSPASSCRSSRRPTRSTRSSDALARRRARATCTCSPASRRALGVDARARAPRGRRSRSCYFGAEDFVADMGGVRTESSTEVLYARSRVALGGTARRRARDRPGRHPRSTPTTRFLADAARRARARLPGQALHPPGPGPARQPRVLAVARGDRPRPPAPGRLRRGGRRAGEAAIAFEGQMVDEPLARHARAVLAAADDVSIRTP